MGALRSKYVGATYYMDSYVENIHQLID
jgi:hypothetical protein